MADETKEKAEKFRDLLHGMAEATAKTFETYLKNNSDASLEAKHKNLVETIEAGFIASQLQLFAVTI